MARYTVSTINGHLQSGNNAETSAVKGKAFEDLVCYLFDLVPGVSITQRNQMNAANTEEIDVAVWNDRKTNGFNFLPYIVLIECKNWSNAVSSIEVNWFASKLERRGLDFGILIANNGITGDQAEVDRAHSIIATHLERKRKIIVITSAEILALRTTADLVRLIKEKLCILAVSGTIC